MGSCASRPKEPRKAELFHQCSRTFTYTMCWINGLKAR
jgi:hypothetical protein